MADDDLQIDAIASLGDRPPDDIEVDLQAPATQDVFQAVQKVRQESDLGLLTAWALTPDSWLLLPEADDLEEQLKGETIVALGGIWTDEWGWPSWGFLDRTGHVWAGTRRDILARGFRAS